MASIIFFHDIFFWPLLFLILLFSSFKPINASNQLSSYIICTDSRARPSVFPTLDDWYMSLLSDQRVESLSGSRIFYSYDVTCHGFAARLTNQEVEKITKMQGIVGVFRDKIMKLHTTRSPDFLGLNVNYGPWPYTNFGENVIIGPIDTGIWPESKSFNDSGLGPIPSGWKGLCGEGTEFNLQMCNRKLIGARFFGRGLEHYLSDSSIEDLGEYRSPRDGQGHGTHTASTAAGAAVADSDMFGFASGIARGIAMKARIAMYKACTWDICSESDVFAAMEHAIQDGVNILSLSLGLKDLPHYENAISRGAFAAVKRKIFVTCSAGNSGPYPYTVENTAPWTTTVGAGSIDRAFPVLVQLGNGKAYVGSSLYSSNFTSRKIPLKYLGDCGSIDTLHGNVTGKIVVCTSEYNPFDIGFVVQEAGGVGLIQLNPRNLGEDLRAVAFTVPAAAVGFKEGLEIITYVHTTEHPTASFRFYNLTVIEKNRAPVVASFSSRGPNFIIPEILKPDLLAPGINILAAFVPNLAPSGSPYDPRTVDFNLLSGTSMACPHVAGAALLLHAAYPNWTPAAIRSALGTTSAIIDNENRSIARYEDMEPATALGIGAGHISPQLAADPGLIYDADVSDYINLLCSLNYTKEQLRLFEERSNPCSNPAGSPGDLNYPSFSVVFRPDNYIQELKRTVTNVGELLPEKYGVRIVNPPTGKVIITVKPWILTFHKWHEKQSYKVKFESKFARDNSSSTMEQMVFAYILWESNKHIVRSPISIMWN